MIKKELHSLKWSTIYQVLTSAISYLTIIILARKYDPIYYGILIFGFNSLEFLKIISDPGITLYNISIFPHIKNRKEFISQVFYVRLILSIFTFIIFLLALFLYSTSFELKIVMLIFSFSIFPYVFDSRWIFQGSLKMNLSFFSRAIFRLLFFTLIVIAIRANAPYYYVPYLLFLASFLGYLSSFPLILRYYGNFTISFRPLTEVIAFLKNTIPIGMNQMLIASNGIIAIFFIGYLMRSSDVGQYGAAYKYSLLVSGILSIILNSLLPIISKNTFNENQFKKYSDFYLNILILSIFSVTIPIIIYTNIIYKLIYGNKYLASSSLAAILTFANLIMAYVHFIGYHLISRGKQSKYTRILFVEFILNLFFLTILLPGYGIYGAGISVFIASIVSLILAIYYYRRYIKPSLSNMLKPLLAVAFSFIITILIHYKFTGWSGLILSVILVIISNFFIIIYFRKRAKDEYQEK
ncbi:MAG: oligosaccharide flippase family protein [Proteobacteria bacterium]|nr:oligosaccharide flippase family protein [Pseudomonadota bacterium]